MEYESDDMPMVYFYEVDLDDGRFSLRAMEVFANRAFTSIFKAMYKKAPGRYREAETFYPLKLEILYDNIPMVLSELIRTAFVPKPGYKFVVADFSAIEARVIAYLAGENWRTEVFKNGGDIYCASASQMFKVPVEKHGQNAHLRQKGKIAELALGYGGSER